MKKQSPTKDVKKKGNSLTYLVIFLCLILVYALTSGGHTPYDYFTRLADAFIDGKFYLTENPSWLNELIPFGNEIYYVVYPPMPAVLITPFRIILKNWFFQEYLSFIIGAGIGILSFKLARTISQNTKIAFWTLLLTSLGTIVWFLSATGYSWYLGQLTAMFFIMLSLNETLNKKRPFIIGVWLGAAFLSRVNLMVVYPFFLLALKGKGWRKNCLLLIVGSAPFWGFNFFYNYIRFGTIFDKAYYLIPGVLDEPWYQKGIFDLSYIPRHIKTIFLGLPKFQDSFPYLKPSWSGLAIWITSPAFIYSLKASIKDKFVKPAWLSIAFVSMVIFTHGTTGFAQFGYRFAVDFYPFLIFLTIKGISKTGLKWHHWVLLTIGFLVNLWGVVFINKLGWVTI